MTAIYALYMGSWLSIKKLIFPHVTLDSQKITGLLHTGHSHCCHGPYKEDAIPVPVFRVSRPANLDLKENIFFS